MSFLLDFIADASGETAVPELLRKMKVLGSLTGAETLVDWANHEIYGYEVDVDLPLYRGPRPVQVLGDFASYGGITQNVRIPAMTFPEDLRNGQLLNLQFAQGIAEIETLAAGDGGSFSWSADMMVLYNLMVKSKKIRAIMEPGFNLVSTSIHIPSHVFAGILDTVRNKALDLALELQREAPEAGQPDADSKTKGVAVQVITNTVNHFHMSKADFSGSNNSFAATDVEQRLARLPTPGPGNSTAL